MPEPKTETVHMGISYDRILFPFMQNFGQLPVLKIMRVEYEVAIRAGIFPACKRILPVREPACGLCFPDSLMLFGNYTPVFSTHFVA